MSVLFPNLGSMYLDFFLKIFLYYFLATYKGIEEVSKVAASVTSLKPLIAEKAADDKLFGKNGSSKRQRVPITAMSYSVASLQVATNCFSQECLVGEGSLGRVYRAEMANGKVE